ncbi:hypothetical protein CXG81DRAFT_12588 [Caulochytrium protostelioides]|uniref:CYRIA/CYRIB Rac1 binding domain-containing protein n=1 Tax=Caulochytrium protostelioides TaxID=1555241 RepID=A0A4P9X6Z7_9FUNG|nr:hypothetical protein CXG81DRAFT_12588 [Caulochytrium protostelioides]|eukprot:RKP00962.1 hypothetical protein CXG81DRAFT_12588 [Caulochytrium protostelioides]
MKPVVCVAALGDVRLADQVLYSDPRKWNELGVGVDKGDEYAPMWAFYANDASAQARLDTVVQRGRALLSRLYSYRSCGRAIPQVQSGEQNRAELYAETYKVLKPEVEKMKAFMQFRDEAVAAVTTVLTPLAVDTEKSCWMSAGLMWRLAQCFELFVVMDAMKSVKGSMNNDFSMFKRTLPNLSRAMAVEDETTTYHKLYLFLGQQDQFASELRKSFKAIPAGEDLLIDLANWLTESCEGGKPQTRLAPQTHHIAMKALTLALSMIALDTDDKERKKRLRLDRYEKVLKSMPVVPLFGDLPVTLTHILGRNHPYAHKWEVTETHEKSKLERHYLLRFTNGIASQIAAATEPSAPPQVADVHASHTSVQLDATEAAQYYKLVVAGMKNMSGATARVLEQLAWKYTHPAPETRGSGEDGGVGADGSGAVASAARPTSYELALAYNHTSAEKQALIDYVSVIKTYANLFNALQRPWVEALTHHIAFHVQAFVAGPLNDALQHAIKKKRGVATVLRHIRDMATAADTVAAAASAAAAAAAATASTASDSAGHFNAVGWTQLHFIQTLLDTTLNERAKGMKGGLMREKDLKETQVTELQAFYQRSMLFPEMLDFASTVQRCSDLSDLWLREFYLELSKQVQFPISMSLPWILTERILRHEENTQIGQIFYAFDIYNDTASRVLHDLRCRYIYDEVVAEVNLCFEQLIVKLSQKLFSEAKRAAARIVLESDALSYIDQEPADVRFALRAFEPILQQREIRILGRTVDMADRIAAMANHLLRASIDAAIHRFEMLPLSAGLGELTRLLAVAHTTHTLLAKHLTLSRWSDLLAEVDESLSLTQPVGRITAHLATELLNDVAPNFCFNSATERFLRSPRPYVAPPERANPGKVHPMHLYGSRALQTAFGGVNALTAGYIGERHFEMIVQLVGQPGIAYLYHQMARSVDDLIRGPINTYVGVIQSGSPQVLKLPLSQYGTAGCYAFFAAHFRPLLTYDQFKPDVLQAFRTFGNTLLLVQGLENALAADGQLADPAFSELVETANAATMDAAAPAAVTALSLRDQVGIAAQLYNDGPLNTFATGTLLHPLLRRVQQVLAEVGAAWRVAGAGVPLLEDPGAFFRVWSSIQFAHCVPTVAGADRTIRDLFGDALGWAGMTILHVLGQTDLYLAFDYNAHILNVHRSERAAVDPKKAAAATATAAAAAAAAAATGGPTGAIGADRVMADFLANAAFFELANKDILLKLARFDTVA